MNCDTNSIAVKEDEKSSAVLLQESSTFWKECNMWCATDTETNWVVCGRTSLTESPPDVVPPPNREVVERNLQAMKSAFVESPPDVVPPPNREVEWKLQVMKSAFEVTFASL